ncbi:hypothetical protein D3C80_2225860 [compost metagenome]
MRIACGEPQAAIAHACAAQLDEIGLGLRPLLGVVQFFARDLAAEQLAVVAA